MRKLVIVTVLLFTGITFATPPKVPTKVTIPTGSLQRLEVEVGKEQTLVYKPTATEEELFVDELSPKNGKVRLLLHSTVKGTYWIAFVFKGDTDIVFTQVVVSDGSPVPPTPPDDDKPKPPVKVNQLKAYLITESKENNANYAKWLQDKTVKDYWNGKGWDGMVIADPDVKDPSTGAVPAKLKPYIDRSKGKKDQLFLVDVVTGDVVFEGDAPQDSQAILTILKKIGG